MNTTTITNATNGMITRVTQFHPTSEHDQLMIYLAVASMIMVGLGLYLMLRKKRPKKR